MFGWLKLIFEEADLERPRECDWFVQQARSLRYISGSPTDCSVGENLAGKSDWKWFLSNQ